MKVLFLVQKEQRVILDRLYDGVEANCDCDLRRLTGKEQAHLKTYFQEKVELSKYDRIILFLRVKKILKQIGFIRSLPNLVILEHDACQNYLGGKYHGKFSQFYRHIPWARILTSGFIVTQKLQHEGFDAAFVPKGYDQELIKNQHTSRDIELGFIGSIRNEAYRQRKEMLETISRCDNLFVTKTESGSAYVDTLNRIKFFVNADVGFTEYMIKNFEAMAAGCILITFDQGQQENQALGFLDMENVVLYQTINDFKQKLALLRENPEKAQQIANKGQQLAEQQFRFDQIGKAITQAIAPNLRERAKDTLWQKLLYSLWY